MKNDSLLTLLLRRLLMMIFSVIGATIIIFSISHLMTNDPALLIAGPKASPETVLRIRQEYGLDLSIEKQYAIYMNKLLNFDFGPSFSTRRPVIQDLADFFPATAELVTYSLFIAVVGGISLGGISARNEHSWVDRFSNLLAMTGVSVPGFWIALLGQLLLYDFLGWLPLGGRLSDEIIPPPFWTGFLTIDSLVAGDLRAFADAVKHIFLPALVISIEPASIIFRIMRASILEVMNEQYITAARAKGVRQSKIYWHHALRNALLPTITTIGLLVGYLMGGSILVESIFSWPGIGRYSANALLSADYNAIMGVTIITVIIYLTANLVVDILCNLLDPRLRSY